MRKYLLLILFLFLFYYFAPFVSFRGYSLKLHLPRFDRVDGINKHHDIYQQTVAYPKNEKQFDDQKKQKRTPHAEFVSDNEAAGASQNVADRIKNGIAEIIERSGIFTIFFDNEIAVFQNFPRAFDKYGNE